MVRVRARSSDAKSRLRSGPHLHYNLPSTMGAGDGSGRSSKRYGKPAADKTKPRSHLCDHGSFPETRGRVLRVVLEKVDVTLLKHASNAPPVKKRAKLNVSRAPDEMAVSAILERRVRTSTLRRGTTERLASASVRLTRYSDSSESEAASDERNLKAKRLKPRDVERSPPNRDRGTGKNRRILSAKSGATRAQRSGASFRRAAKEDSLSRPSLTSSEDGDSSYHCPTGTETESTESSSEWEELTSDGTSSRSTSSWEESSSGYSTESIKLSTHSRNMRNCLRSSRQRKQAHPLSSDKKTWGSRVAKSKVATAKRDTPRRSLDNSDVDSECLQKEDIAQSGKGSLLAKQEMASGNNTRQVRKASDAVGLKRKREETSSGSHNSEEWLPMRSRDSESYQSAARIVQTRSPARAHSDYGARRRSLRARREGVLSPALSRCRARLTRKSTWALLSQELKSEESGDCSRDVQSKPLQTRRSHDSLAAQTGTTEVAKDGLAGRRVKDAPSSDSLCSSNGNSDDVEDSSKNDYAYQGGTSTPNKLAGSDGRYARAARLVRRQWFESGQQLSTCSNTTEDQKTSGCEWEVPRISARRNLWGTGNVTEVRCVTRSSTVVTKGGNKTSHVTIAPSKEGSNDILRSPRGNAIKPRPRSGRRATRMQTVSLKQKKNGVTKSAFMTGACGNLSSCGLSSASQLGSNSSVGAWKDGIVEHAKKGVLSKQPKKIDAQTGGLTKENMITKKRHPSSSSSGHSAEEWETTESEDSRTNQRKPRTRVAASTRGFLKFGCDSVQDAGNRLTEGSSSRVARENKTTQHKQQQLQTASVRANNVGTDGAEHFQKDRVAQSKVVSSEEQGHTRSRAQLKASTGLGKSSASSSSLSSIEEFLTSKTDLEEFQLGQKTLQPQLVSSVEIQQLGTVAEKVGKENLTGGSLIRAKDNDKPFRGSLNMPQVSSDNSRCAQKKGAAQSRPNLPATNRSRQQTAAQTERRATRSSLQVTRVTSLCHRSGSSGCGDSHLRHSREKGIAHLGKNLVPDKTSMQLVKGSSEAVAVKGDLQAPQFKKPNLKIVIKSLTSSTDHEKLQAQPRGALHKKHVPQAEAEVTQVIETRLTRGRLAKARSENTPLCGLRSASGSEDIEQLQRGVSPPIVKRTNGEMVSVRSRAPKGSKSVTSEKPKPTTLKEPRKAQVEATVPTRLRGTIERKPLRPTQNSSATASHSDPVEVTDQGANLKEGSRKTMTRYSRSSDRLRSIENVEVESSNRNRLSGTKQTILAQQETKSSLPRKPATVMEELPPNKPSALNHSNRFIHLREKARTYDSKKNTVNIKLVPRATSRAANQPETSASMCKQKLSGILIGLRRKCAGDKALASQKRPTIKRATRTCSKASAEKHPEMDGTTASLVKQCQTVINTEVSSKPKEKKPTALRLRGQRTSETKAAGPVHVDQAMKPNSAASPKQICEKGCGRGRVALRQEETAAPVNQRKGKAWKDSNVEPLAATQPTKQCDPITRLGKQGKASAVDQSTTPAIPPTAFTAGRRAAVAVRQRPAARPKGKSKPPLDAAITAGKGTLKRKRQLRKAAEALAAASTLNDDICEPSFLPQKRLIPDLLYQKSAQESAEDSLIVAGMKTPVPGSVCGSPWKNRASPGTSLCSATSSPFRAAEEIVHAIQKQAGGTRWRPCATSTPRVKLKPRKVTKNILVNLNKLERQLQTIEAKEDRLGHSDLELDYFSEDSSLL